MIVASHLGHISGLHDVSCMAAGYVSPHYIYIVCIIVHRYHPCRAAIIGRCSRITGMA